MICFFVDSTHVLCCCNFGHALLDMGLRGYKSEGIYQVAGAWVHILQLLCNTLKVTEGIALDSMQQ